ncbi:hypothetical protein FD51_GL001187 [Lacticaseibacillus zeae DSM 20178 = KCTC 3804]|nr:MULTISPECIES: enhanced serine sensitivity protein SseB C-terminal domain-containing protein [Lacticaseibacillus]KRK11231.1 hypothetical protein FD51_GL001187 [Lacticaseibacillus zeae DSM 20178 = KCTC 3804]MDE3283243.1 enhanced serine sensitivity protein SseB C-terminal domain-containing protein [Lacticaseibacillus casei]OLS09961.1 hypothetical protein AUQ39_04855 [Lacticaseibacillus casei]QVI31403.1 enhanced serine sensitivity protein SseB C-terminal domain-containing protein [Lacticaseibaci
MGLFDRFKKQTEPTNFFKGPRNEKGFQQVIDWLKQANEIILVLSHDRKMKIGKDGQGALFLNAYTDVSQIQPMLKKGDVIATMTFEGLQRIFEENGDLSYLWLNPHSDSAQVYRSLFTPRHTFSEGEAINIGLPATPPKPIIDLLEDYARRDSGVAAIYFGLMQSNNEFSYLVYIDSPNNHEIVAKLGPQIKALYQSNNILYPVDFTYENFMDDAKYLIYQQV